MFIIIPFLVLHNKKGNYYKRFDGSLTTAAATRMATSLHEHHAFLYITLLMQETRTWRFLVIFTFYGRRRKTKTFLFLFLNLNPVQKDATLLDGTCWVRLHTLLRVVWGLLRKVWNVSFVPWSSMRMHARASHFLVHFHSVTTRLWRENA